MLHQEELNPVRKNFSNGVNGVFETMRAYKGKVFMLEEHITRLLESSKTAGIEIPTAKEELKRIINAALKNKGLKDAYIRFAINSGVNGKVKFNVVVKEEKVYPAEFYAKGVSVVTVATRRNTIESQNPKIKSSSFLNGIFARLDGLRHFEPLMLNDKGMITEGTVSNIFIVKDNSLFTPPTYLGILNGITRNVVLKLAKTQKIKTYEIPFTRYDLFNADESFLTNTSMEIMPIVNCDARKIGNGRPGPITNLLRREFKKIIGDGPKGAGLIK